MTLNETVLQKLAEWQHSGEGRQTLGVPDGGCGWTVTVSADRHDGLGSALWDMSLQRTRSLPEGSQVTLRGWAENAVAKVTGLLEPLSVVEIDMQRDEALLRSNQPSRRSADLFYYEVLLQGTKRATVRRYRASEHGGHRDQVAFTLTHESAAKLAADLAFDQ